RGEVQLRVFDTLGREIKTLVNEKLPAGRHEVRWRGDNQFGEQVPSGVYLYQLRVDGRQQSGKMTLLK
ncbi:MAG TPA: FlgD immunoglobulin-like domain containing protein, partial [Calditrichia bacterium]|nr:FlgD immunoglobulin-like domain containing protein [Calditrichia bacterium]